MLCFCERYESGGGPIRKLNILIVNWRDLRNPEAGGAEVHLHEIFGRIAADRHKVTLLAHRFPGSAGEEMVDGIRVLRTGHKFDFNFHVLPFYYRRLRHERFDVVVEDLNKLPFFLPFALRRPSAALIHHFFGSSIWKETNPLFATYVGLGEWIVRHTYRNVPFCAVSESTADELYANGFQKSGVTIIHNAVDHSIYRTSSDGKRVKGRIIYLGRVKKYKGIDQILRALLLIRKELPDAHLVVVGGGDDVPRLRRITDELGLKDVVTFSGFVTTESKIDLLQKAEVMVTPSPKEGWGVTTIEANACGTPVVASNVPGLRDAVRDGETGFLYPYGDVPAMAKAVTELLSDDKLREKFATAAIAWAGRFRWENSAKETVQWLESVIEKS